MCTGRECDVRDPVAFDDARKRIRSLVAEHCGDGAMLDAGGGDGRILADGQAIVLDLDEGLLRSAKTHDASVMVGDMQALPCRAESFDGILLCHALEHCPDTVRVLNEVERVLKPNGHVVIAVPNAAGLGQIRNLILGDVRPAGNRPGQYPQHQHQYTLGLLLRLVRSQPWAEVCKVLGDVVSFPFMRMLRLRWLGRVWGAMCPRLSDGMIVVCRKRASVDPRRS